MDMEFKDLLKRAKSYFEHYVDVEKFYFTADGTAFKDKRAADAHANFLKNLEIKEVLRIEVMKEEKVAAQKTDEGSRKDANDDIKNAEVVSGKNKKGDH